MLRCDGFVPYGTDRSLQLPSARVHQQRQQQRQQQRRQHQQRHRQKCTAANSITLKMCRACMLQWGWWGHPLSSGEVVCVGRATCCMCEGTMAVKRPSIAMMDDDADSALPAAAGRRTCIYGGDKSSDITAAAFVSLARATWSGGKGGR